MFQNIRSMPLSKTLAVLSICEAWKANKTSSGETVPVVRITPIQITTDYNDTIYWEQSANCFTSSNLIQPYAIGIILLLKRKGIEALNV